MKEKTNSWICGLMSGKREYKINAVTYIVSARYEDKESKNTIRSRFERVITNEMIDLMDEPPDSIMKDEDVCSAAGKED